MRPAHRDDAMGLAIGYQPAYDPRRAGSHDGRSRFTHRVFENRRQRHTAGPGNFRTGNVRAGRRHAYHAGVQQQGPAAGFPNLLAEILCFAPLGIQSG